MSNGKIIGLVAILALFFLALAMLDYHIMHHQNTPEWMYRYWINLGVVVVAFAFIASYIVYLSRLPKNYIVATFLTVIMLFFAGTLDLFYFVLATLRGEPYSFEIWSAQYKWFGSWDWPRQIMWTLACFAIIALIWQKTLKTRN